MNDAQSFNSLLNIGPNGSLPFPPKIFILGDEIYPFIYPLFLGSQQHKYVPSQLLRENGA